MPRFDNFDKKFQKGNWKRITLRKNDAQKARNLPPLSLYSSCRVIKMEEEEGSAKEGRRNHSREEGAQKSESRGNYGRGRGEKRSAGLTVRLKGKRQVSFSLSLCFEKPEEVGRVEKGCVCVCVCVSCLFKQL